MKVIIDTVWFVFSVCTPSHLMYIQHDFALTLFPMLSHHSPINEYMSRKKAIQQLICFLLFVYICFDTPGYKMSRDVQYAI